MIGGPPAEAGISPMGTSRSRAPGWAARRSCRSTCWLAVELVESRGLAAGLLG